MRRLRKLKWRNTEQWAYEIQQRTGIELNYEGLIYGNKWRVDLYNDDLKIAIEINPTITHSSEPTVFHNRMVDEDYHQKRAQRASENGWILIQVFDWDSQDEVIELIEETIKSTQDEVVEITTGDKTIEMITKSGYTHSLIYIETQGEVYIYADKVIPKMSSNAIEQLKDFFKVDLYFITNQSHSADYKIKEQCQYIGSIKPEAVYANIDTSEVITIDEAYTEFDSNYGQSSVNLRRFMNEKRFYRVYNAGSEIYKVI